MTTKLIRSYEGKEIRILGTPDKPLFVAVDVCDILGLTNPTEILKSLDDDETTLSLTEVRSGNGTIRETSVNVVTESGLYHLIFKSRKPAAKNFRRWITREVLPSIRRTGTYSSDVEATSSFEQSRKRRAIYITSCSLQDSLTFFGALMSLGTGYNIQISLNKKVQDHFYNAYHSIRYNIPTVDNPSFDVLNPPYSHLTPNIIINP